MRVSVYIRVRRGGGAACCRCGQLPSNAPQSLHCPPRRRVCAVYTFPPYKVSPAVIIMVPWQVIHVVNVKYFLIGILGISVLGLCVCVRFWWDVMGYCIYQSVIKWVTGTLQPNRQSPVQPQSACRWCWCLAPHWPTLLLAPSPRT